MDQQPDEQGAFPLQPGPFPVPSRQAEWRYGGKVMKRPDQSASSWPSPMDTELATITAKGQVTIRKSIREALRLQQGRSAALGSGGRGCAGESAAADPLRGDDRRVSFPWYPAYRDSGIVWIGELPEHDGFLDLDDLNTILISESALERDLLRPGDVLMNKGGDFDKLGCGCIGDGAIKDYNLRNHVFAVRPHSLPPSWLNVYTSSMQANSTFIS